MRVAELDMTNSNHQCPGELMRRHAEIKLWRADGVWGDAINAHASLIILKTCHSVDRLPPPPPPPPMPALRL